MKACSELWHYFLIVGGKSELLVPQDVSETILNPHQDKAYYPW